MSAVARSLACIFLCLVSVTTAYAQAQPLATAEPKSPATKPAAQIRTWIQQLGNADTPVREKARDNLMCLTSADLPTIRQAVSELAPRIRPSQVSYLRDIVFQLYLSGLEYEPEVVLEEVKPLDLQPDVVIDPRTGQPIAPAPKAKTKVAPFVGISWPDTQINTDFTVASPEGVVVARRLRGFSAYRLLRDGDIITGIVEAPELRLTGQGDFSRAVKDYRVGDTLMLNVLRNGDPIQVPVTLVSKPKDVSAVTIEPWLQLREDRAEEYWQANFQPILKDEPADARRP